jgi:hypothetical protein
MEHQPSHKEKELASSLKLAKSKRPSKRPPPEDIKKVILHVLKMLEADEEEVMQMPKEERKETEGWLDWALQLAKDYGPMLMEVAPKLIALL